MRSAMEPEGDGQSALAASEDERVDYLTAVAAMAFSETPPSEEDLTHLRDLCDALAVGEFAAEVVDSAAHQPEAARVDEVVPRLRASELRFSLVADVVYVALVAGVDPGTAVEIDAIAAAVDVPPAQLEQIRRYVEERHSTSKGGNGHPTASKKRAEIEAALATAGVPIAAVALSAALGAPTGGGLGAAAWLGVSSFASVRWLLGRLGG
jgi:hypothetical protein